MTPTTPAPDAFDADGRGLQHQGLRKANERAVLTVIGFNAGVSNAEISRLSGLAPQTVSAILTELDRAGLIVRGDVLRGRRGQPATPISLRREGAYAIGVEIGWRHVEVMLINLHGEAIARHQRLHAYPDSRTICDTLVDMVWALRQTLSPSQQARLLDMGIAMPGHLAEVIALSDAPAEQGTLWHGLDLAEQLSRRTGLDVSLFNDGNAACWAELIGSPRPRPASFIYFLISRYIAAGIFGEGMLWEGPSGHSANLGSMLVSDATGQVQSAHAIASVAALEARLGAAGMELTDRPIQDWDWQGFEPVLEQWIADSACALSHVVYNATMVVESGLVILDTVLPGEITNRLVAALEAQLRTLPVIPHTPPHVQAGHLGGDAPALGAAELTLYRRFFSRTLADLAS